METYSIGPEVRMRVQEFYAALLRTNPEELNAVRSIIETRRGYP